MLLFRSEEHLARWRQRTQPPASNVLTLEQAGRLAHAWYARKLEPDWRRHTPDEAEALFRELDLDMKFWALR
jgi:hypothetical protein